MLIGGELPGFYELFEGELNDTEPVDNYDNIPDSFGEDALLAVACSGVFLDAADFFGLRFLFPSNFIIHAIGSGNCFFQ